MNLLQSKECLLEINHSLCIDCKGSCIESEIIFPLATNRSPLNKMSNHYCASYLPDSWSHAVPALPEQNSMPIGWRNLGDLCYWLKIPQLCCCYTWGCLDQRWGRKVPQLIPQNFKDVDSGIKIWVSWLHFSICIFQSIV